MLLQSLYAEEFLHFQHDGKYLRFWNLFGTVAYLKTSERLMLLSTSSGEHHCTTPLRCLIHWVANKSANAALISNKQSFTHTGLSLKPRLVASHHISWRQRINLTLPRFIPGLCATCVGHMITVGWHSAALVPSTAISVVAWKCEIILQQLLVKLLGCFLNGLCACN